MADDKIPPNISQYIRDRFRGSFSFNIKTVRDPAGHKFFNAEISQDEIIYHLKFNEQGRLIEEDAEEAFPDEPELLE